MKIKCTNSYRKFCRRKIFVAWRFFRPISGNLCKISFAPQKIACSHTLLLEGKTLGTDFQRFRKVRQHAVFLSISLSCYHWIWGWKRFHILAGAASLQWKVAHYCQRTWVQNMLNTSQTVDSNDIGRYSIKLLFFLHWKHEHRGSAALPSQIMCVKHEGFTGAAMPLLHF